MLARAALAVITPYSGISKLIDSDELRKFRVFPGRSHRPVRSIGSATLDRFPWLVAGEWQTLIVEPSISATALGVTDFVFELMKNGASTGVSQTWSGTDVSRKSFTGTVSSNGTTDSFALEFRPNPERDPIGMAFSFKHAIEFDSDDRYTSGYAVIGFDGPNDANEWWNSPFYPADDWFNGASSCMTLVGPPGVIQGYRVLAPAAHTAGTLSYVLELDGVIQDGSGATVDTRLSLGPSVFDATASFSLPVTTRQTIRIRATATGIADGRRPSFGIKFRATTAHRFWLGGWDGGGGSFGATPTTDYIAIGAETQNHDWQTSPTQLNGGVVEWVSTRRVTLDGLSLWVAGAPGGSATRTYDPYINGAVVFGGPSVVLSGSATEATDDGAIFTIDEGDTLSLRNVTGGAATIGDSTDTAWVFTLASASAVAIANDLGEIGPHIWVEWPRRVSDGSTATNIYSDQDMQCPGSYYGGFKEARILSCGTADRALSHPVSGEWTGSTFSLELSDYDRSIRERLASLADRYWSQPLTIRMVSRSARAALATPYTAFVGPIIDAQPSGPLSFGLTLGDIISRTVMTDQGLLPWRLIRDGFLDQLTTVAEKVEQSEIPEPIIYGSHTRRPGDAPSSAGFCVLPTYLGIEDVGGDDWHVWLVAGHACSDIPDIYVDGTSAIADEGTDWLVPHHAGWAAEFATPYRDRNSSTFSGTDRRYTLIYGKVTDVSAHATELTDPDACALGHKQLTVAVHGIETDGDGTGDLITDRLEQYKHFVQNFIANRGPEGYQSGAWLETPTWSLYDGEVPVIDEESFDDCTAIGLERLPDDDGYVGAAVIGARDGDRQSVRRWIAMWNRSCATRCGFTHLGQFRVTMLHPTQAIKDAAPLYTDATEILEDSFSTSIGWDDQANRIPWRADLNYATGAWMTSGIVTDATAIANYERELLGEQREYQFAPGVVMAAHLAYLELLTTVHPPRMVMLDVPVVDDLGDSLAYLDLGDYIRYQHFASVSEDSAEIRIAQIVKHQVQVGGRRVRVYALDCEDLLHYDNPAVEEAFSGSISDPSMTMVDSPVDTGSVMTGAEMFV